MFGVGIWEVVILLVIALSGLGMMGAVVLAVYLAARAGSRNRDDQN